jgi:hypothetical protein
MKTIITAIAATLFTAAVNADDVYHGLADGNPDLFDSHQAVTSMTGVQPSVGDSFDRYHGLADGNSDLFKADRSGPTDSGEAPDIYGKLSGNPDLRF